jgi:Planctomycete cytochrome C
MPNLDRTRQLVVLLLSAAGAAGCDSSTPIAATSAAGADAGACLEPLSLDCQVATQPTYPELFNNILLKTCGSPTTGASCHAPAGSQGGLVLSDMTQAYDYLLGNMGGRARVIPGDPECSIVERRLESTDPNFGMPPGGRLSEGLRCAVRQWIANGASKQ